MRGDAGETIDVFVEIETAIEAPPVAREIPLGVLWVKRSTSAGDRALDVAKTDVSPLEALVLWSPAAGDHGLVLEPRIGKPAKAAKAVAHDAGAEGNVGLRMALMASLVSPGMHRNWV